MYASMKGSKTSVRMTASERRAWNDALQATVLALACKRPGRGRRPKGARNEPDPLCPDALIDADPCVDCVHKDRARELIIKRVLALKLPTECGDLRGVDELSVG